jgi:hypothetical protein
VDEVAAVGAYHGLAYDLDIAIAKQSKFRHSSGGRPGGDDQPILIDERASDAAQALRKTLAKWARVIASDTGAEQPRDSLPAIAAWLRRRIRWVAGRDDAAQAYEEICSAVRAARIAVDRPGDRVYVGQCDEDGCGQGLYARPGDQWAVCRAEVHAEPLMWPVDDRRNWLLQQAADFVGTSTEVAAALSRYARPVTKSVIRGLDYRGVITPVQVDSRGRKLWRLGDVLDAVAPILTSEKAAS